MASALGIAPGTVKSRLSRARTRLAAALGASAPTTRPAVERNGARS
ncbi:sigma factor-like helix-turn-helix DNA-binding protein [Curtobacterium sp. B18]|nr:sigma factor-like helix-turn-helix DNA-binding protein [Curtobacterium sp. B18]